MDKRSVSVRRKTGNKKLRACSNGSYFSFFNLQIASCILFSKRGSPKLDRGEE